MKKAAKKGLCFSLCAVLAGGAAANVITGWNHTEVQAAIDQDAKITLLKSESETSSAGKGSLDVSAIVEEAMPFVVSITTKSIQEVMDYYGMFGYGGYVTEKEVEGSGSGIIIGKNDEQLMVATNYHVVEGATTVSVSFIDGSVCEATVKGFDEDRDLAVVAIDLSEIEEETMEQISIAPMGSSDDLKVGEQVLAIGNALGYGQSVTTGIVSAKNRKMSDSGVSEREEDDDDSVNLIQTDAAINPGNSGGALLNMNGEVVGINSAKLASTEVEGMCYAIAISDVSDILENLMNSEAREQLEDDEHGVLGITGTSVSTEGAQVYGMPEGVFVVDVVEGGAAEKAGIKANYIITEFDGKRVRSIDSLVELLTYYAPGEEIEVTLKIMDSEGYAEKVVTVTLDENTNAASSDEEDSEKKEQAEEKSSILDEFGDNDESQDGEEEEDELFPAPEEDGEMPSIDDFLSDWY